ncbi:ATP-binding protein [Desulfococcaceae bacterium HSG9]|nr:ATP-binding protein [Desulfococcaceae bacterium HSG9]
MRTKPSMFNIAIVGGGQLCKEILNKATLNFKDTSVNARFTAVADPDPETPGMKLAGRLGLKALKDYRDLYLPDNAIDLIIVSQPKQKIFKNILKTRPSHIRIMNYHIFNLFWNAIRTEERKLKAQNDEMKTIFNGIQDFILILTPEMDVVEANGSFLDKMGYKSQQIIGMKCYDIYQKSYAQCMANDSCCPLLNVIRNKHKSRMVQTQVMPDGGSRYYEVDVYPIWEKNGKISKFIHISRDVTDRKRQELENTRKLEKMVEKRTRLLKETHEKLLHQDKMASLGKLSASVVHEINNPIAGILNLIMLVQRICSEGPVRERETEQFGQYLNLMETETRRIGKIVSNLLSFSRQSGVKFKPIDINQLIDITLFMNSNLLKLNGIKVEKSTDPHMQEFTGSRDQLQQVFMNFISNAAESMQSTGESVLSIKTHYNQAKNKVIVSFSDTGVGIPRENISKLFEPFFTTKKQGKGIGLGLSVAYGIIKDHGGCINVKSEVGHGATFIIELPIKE